MIRPLVALGLLVAGLLSVPASAAPSQPLAFTPATVVDPVLGGSAPALVADLSPAGRALDRSFVAWRPAGLDDAVALYRSDDGARSFLKRYGDPADPAAGGPACSASQTPTCLPGPGTGVALASDPRSGDLVLAAGATAVSRDGGATVATADTDLSTAPGAAVGAAAPSAAVRLVARQVGDAVVVGRSEAAGAAGSWTLPLLPQLQGTAGGLAADRSGRVYVPLLTGGRAVVGVSTDGGSTFAVRGPGLPARVAPRLAVDSAGGVVLVAVRPDGGVVLTRSAAGAGRWSAPVRVDGAGRPAGALSASVVAGDPGRTAVAWYGRALGGWAPRVATVVGGGVRTTTASRTPAAVGTAPGSFTVPPALALDGRGQLLLAWTSATGALPSVLVSREASGPSLRRGAPAAARPAAGTAPDGAGDARFPLTGRAPGPRRPGLDLTGTSVSLRPDGVVELRVGVADTAQLGRSGVDGSAVSYVTRYDLDGRTWFARATVAPGRGPVFAAGQLGSGQVLRTPAVGGTAARSNSFTAGGGASGRVEAGRLVLHVPARFVGRPRPGSRLLSVSTSALVGPPDGAPEVAPGSAPPLPVGAPLPVRPQLPVVADATPAYDTVVGRPALVDGLVTALRPARLLDTRRSGGALRPGATRSLQVTGRGGVPSGATSVLLQVTALAPAAAGEVRVGSAAPLPVSKGRTTGSLVLSAVAPGGRVSLSSTGSTGLLVDVVGVVRDGAGSSLSTPAARRLLDTRHGAPLTSAPRRVAAPAGARAVLLSVTVTAARTPGVVQVWGSGTRPSAGGLPAEPRRTTTTTVLSQVAGDGSIGLATTAGAAHVTVDLVGVLGARGSRTYPVPPATVVDTRTGGVPARPGQVLVARTGARVPATARQVLLQVTAYGSTSAGYLTVWPGGPRPDAASLRLVPGRTTTGLVLVDLPASRAASVYVSAGRPHVRVDVVGATHD